MTEEEVITIILKWVSNKLPEGEYDYVITMEKFLKCK